MAGNTTYEKEKKEKERLKPLIALNTVMYGTKHQRNIGEVDQAYEDLRRWIKERMRE